MKAAPHRYPNKYKKPCRKARRCACLAWLPAVDMMHACLSVCCELLCIRQSVHASWEVHMLQPTPTNVTRLEMRFKICRLGIQTLHLFISFIALSILNSNATWTAIGNTAIQCTTLTLSVAPAILHPNNSSESTGRHNYNAALKRYSIHLYNATTSCRTRTRTLRPHHMPCTQCFTAFLLPSNAISKIISPKTHISASPHKPHCVPN